MVAVLGHWETSVADVCLAVNTEACFSKLMIATEFLLLCLFEIVVLVKIYQLLDRTIQLLALIYQYYRGILLLITLILEP